MGTPESFIREIVNAQWLVLDLILTGFFMYYGIVRPKATGKFDPSWVDRHLSVDSQFSFAMSLYISGYTLRSLYVWALLSCQRTKGDCRIIQDDAWVLILASALVLGGSLWCVRVLSPTHWRPWSWLGVWAVYLGVLLAYGAWGVSQ